VGDSIYGKVASVNGIPVERQFLHASRLGFSLPDGRSVTFRSPLPSDLQGVLDRLRDRGGE
jgi:23S rRNA-/tRNA-specific pseudouridylate synthase